jgi:competence protein ComFC
LKYRGDQSAAGQIVEAAVQFLTPRRAAFNLLVPVPPSRERSVQPVILLANGIGARLKVPVVECVTTTRGTTQLKTVTDPAEREQLLRGLYAVDAARVAGRNVLLFDDLYRYGSTPNAITRALLRQGAANVYALTITRTRSNR